jgi:hypothetical protein
MSPSAPCSTSIQPGRPLSDGLLFSIVDIGWTCTAPPAITTPFGVLVALTFILLLDSNEVVIEEYIQIYIVRGW